ncbi:MAG TPA: FGGY family carbohydrate kinase [Bacillota bacterium]|nr:FGGY family carbohydrate kinase [Bacillota bacterium]
MSCDRKECYLAIDSGTSSIRVGLLDENLNVFKIKRIERLAQNNMSAEKEWGLIAQLIRQIFEENPSVGIVSVGVSQFISWMVIDERGNPLTDVYLYSDQKIDELKRAIELIGAKEIYERTARRPSSEFGILKLLHLKNNDTNLYNKACFLISMKDYVNYKLTGEIFTDYTSACYSMALNVKEKCWDPEILDRFDISPGKLPPLKYGAEIVGRTSKTCREELGLQEGIPVAAGGPDGSLGIIGAAGSDHGVFASVMGTTDVCFVMTEKPVLDGQSKGLITNISPIRDIWMVGGPTGFSGGTVDWFIKNFTQSCSFNELTDKARFVPAGSGGLLMNLGITGERAPIWNSGMLGSIVGLNPDTKPEHIFRAMMESNAYLSRSIYDMIDEAGVAVNRMVATGGGASNPLWMEIKASVMKLPLSVPKERQSTLRGAGILAMLCADPGGKILPQEMTQFFPDEAAQKDYDYLYIRYKEFIKSLNNYYLYND